LIEGSVAVKDLPEIWNAKYKEYLEAEYPDFRERLQDIEQLALFAQRQPDLSKFLTAGLGIARCFACFRQ
jgi:hypothetical protein